jgi:hypothetical protein
MVQPVALGNFAELSIEDTVSLEITPGSDPSRVEFILESSPAVTWWKALELHGAGNGIFRDVETQDGNHGPRAMAASLTELRGARLVLAKAKLLGFHTGMYELRNLDAQAGNRMRFVWQRDEDRDGPVAGFFRDLGRGVSIAANAVADAVETAVNAIGDAIADLIEFIGNVIAGILDALGTALAGIPGIGQALRTFLHWLGTIVSTALDLVATFFKAIYNVVGDVVGGIIRVVGGAIGGLLALDAGLAGRTVLQGLQDMGAGVAGAVILVSAKILAYVQAIFFMQMGERPLTKDERTLLERVFRGSIAYSNIRIIEGFAGLFSINDRAFTLGDRIYLKDVDPAMQPDILVHEGCHVWQYQHFGSRYLMEALVSQIPADGYDWQVQLARGVPSWQQFNREAQAQFIQDLWNGGRQVSPVLAGHGVFFRNDPVDRDVAFDASGTAQTSLAVEAVAYMRSLVSFRLSRLF